MTFISGDRFWCLTIEPPGKTRQMVFGIVYSYLHSRDAYSVIWDTSTPKHWIEWSNNKMYETSMHKCCYTL